MNATTMQCATSIVNNRTIVECFARLKARWMDEHEYENINDYVSVMQRTMPKDVTIVRAVKRPFAFDLRLPNDARIFRLSENRNHLRLESVK